MAVYRFCISKHQRKAYEGGSKSRIMLSLNKLRELSPVGCGISTWMEDDLLVLACFGLFLNLCFVRVLLHSLFTSVAYCTDAMARCYCVRALSGAEVHCQITRPNQTHQIVNDDLYWMATRRQLP